MGLKIISNITWEAKSKIILKNQKPPINLLEQRGSKTGSTGQTIQHLAIAQKASLNPVLLASNSSTFSPRHDFTHAALSNPQALCWHSHVCDGTKSLYRV